jgi:L-ascorbate metabolism protein UlaG (beta-lactamase superfamily)
MAHHVLRPLGIGDEERQMAVEPQQARPTTTRAPRRAPRAPDHDRVQFIGNATLLLRYGALTLLTDPNFVHRGAEVELGYGLTSTRLTDPALDVEELPPIDAVLLSHDHGDHFDAVAADWLSKDVPIITTPSAAAQLSDRGFTALRPLATWESAEIEKGDVRLRLTALPAQHGAGMLSLAMPETMGTLLELWRVAPEPLRIYISGDTVIHDGIDEIAARFPAIDLAFLHLGGMRVLGMAVSMDADQGVELLRRIGARIAIPIHYNDYGTDSSTLAEFVARVGEAGLQDRVRYLQHGDSWSLEARPG